MTRPSESLAVIIQSLADIRQDMRRQDVKLDHAIERLGPVPGLIDDVSGLTERVGQIETAGHRRAGVIAAASAAITGIGVLGWDKLSKLLGLH